MDRTHSQKSACPYTSECLRLLDEIETYGMAHGWPGDAASFTETTHDLQIEQLAQHLKSCSICQHAVAGVHQTRDAQRRILRSVLAESESKVPPVTSSILTAIRQEAAHARENPAHIFASNAREFSVSTPITPNPASEPRRKRSRSRIGTFLALAAAAVIILASVGLFGMRAGLFGQKGTNTAHQSTKTSTAQTAPNVTVAPASSFGFTADNTWPSVLINRSTNNGQQNNTENDDTANNKLLPLLQSCCTKNIAIDGILPDGKNLIYRTWDNQQTYYHLLTGQTYTIAGHGSNAVWSNNNGTTTIYVSAADTLYLLDAQTLNLMHTVKIALNADHLEQYQENYLYFSRLSPDGHSRSLYRIPVNQQNTPIAVDGPILTASASSSFWYRQDGIHGFYYIENKNLFFANLDTRTPGEPVTGTLASNNSVPVGYNTSDGSFSLLYIQQTQSGTFQLMDVHNSTAPIETIGQGATSLCQNTPPTDRAPICDDSIALNPFNTQFVYGASYPDGSYKLFADNWQTHGGPTLISNAGNQSRVQLIGWDSIVPK